MLEKWSQRTYEMNTGFNTKYFTTFETIRKICDRIIGGEKLGTMFEESSQYINSVILWPLYINDKTTLASARQVNIKIGTKDMGYTGAKIGRDTYDVKTFNYNILCYFYINALHNDFRDLLASYTLYLPFLEGVEINTKSFYKRNLYVLFSVEWDTGVIYYYIVRGQEHDSFSDAQTESTYIGDDSHNNDFEIMATYKAQVGIALPIGSNSAAMQRLQATIGMIQGFSQAVQGFVSGGMSGMASAAAGDVVGAAKGQAQVINGAIGGATTIVNSALMGSFNTLQKGEKAQGGFGALINSECRLTRSMPETPDGFSEGGFNSILGTPCCRTAKLSDLKGFTKCGEVHLENIDGATSTELDMLERALINGVHL